MCGTALIACQGWVILSAALIPVLYIRRPVLLEMVNGSLIAVAAAGAFVRSGHASLVVGLAAPMILWLPVDAVSWWAGRCFGARTAEWLTGRYPKRVNIVARCERFIDRYGFASVILGPIVPLPTALIFAATGWRRMPLALFLSADMIGIVSRGMLALAAGYFFGGRGISIARHYSEYSAVAVGVLVAVLFVMIIVRVVHILRGRARD
jgi:membrane protein DedA with SNARE-associated domain